MATDVVSIYNRALSALGTTSSVTTPTEVSREAEQCNLWYEKVRDTVFSAAPWSSLSAFKRLALLAERDPDLAWTSSDPDPRWLYAYGLPADFLRPRHLSTYTQFELSVVGTVRALVSNEPNSILAYTRRVENPELWGVELEDAVIFALAAHIAKPLTGKDSDLRNMFQLAQEKILVARTNDANMHNSSVEHIPDWIGARGFALAGPQSKYIYPSADFTVSGFNNVT